MKCLVFYERSDHKLIAYVNDEDGNALGGADIEVTIITYPDRTEVSGASWPLDMVQQPTEEQDKVLLPGGDTLVDKSISYEVTLPYTLGIQRGQDYSCVFDITYQNKKLYIEKLMRGSVKT